MYKLFIARSTPGCGIIVEWEDHQQFHWESYFFAYEAERRRTLRRVMKYGVHLSADARDRLRPLILASSGQWLNNMARYALPKVPPPIEDPKDLKKHDVPTGDPEWVALELLALEMVYPGIVEFVTRTTEPSFGAVVGQAKKLLQDFTVEEM